MKITIDVDFDDLDNKPTAEQVQEWVEFQLGINSIMSNDNPMDDIDLFYLYTFVRVTNY